MKTITDEYMEENWEEVERQSKEYAEYASNSKIALIKSLKFYAVTWGLVLVIGLLATLLKWKILAMLVALLETVAIFGGYVVGFYYKGVKPVYKLLRYYLVSIMEKLRNIGGFFNIIPFVGLIINLWVMIIDLWLITIAISIWLFVSPLAYFLAYKFFNKLSKGYKDGLEWHNKRKARNYADIDEAE